MAYELAVKPDIQQRLREEIEEANENCNETLTLCIDGVEIHGHGSSFIEQFYFDIIL